MADVTSPYNDLFVSPATVSGTEPTVKNADGTAINSGGKTGTLTTPNPTAVVAPASFTAPPAPTQPASGKKF